MANAFVFKDVTGEDIKEVEDFVRNDLLELLEEKATVENVNLSEEKRSTFFGNFYSNPKKFVFSLEERQQIMKCVNHVNYKVDLDGINENLAHFFIEKNEPPKPSKTNQSDNKVPRSHTHAVLNRLIDLANQNVERKKEGYRFDDEIKAFASYIRLVGGRYTYETLQKNLELCLPSVSSTDRFIRKMKNAMVEGVVRFDDLAKYLKERNLPPFVALSEDATRITGTVQYDVKTNQLVGFVLPLNEENGMPIPYTFPARTGEEILEHFRGEPPIGNFVNVIMAQPLCNASPFCLLLFASDSKYTSDHVADRWTFISEELKKVNVTALTFSSDSDPKFNSAMKNNSGLGQESDIFHEQWFCCSQSVQFPFYIQDIVHIATKLRNLFLKTLESPYKLPFGKDLYISTSHLEYLIKHVGKDKHMLTASVLNPEDRQNFASVERMCDRKVIDSLRDYVKNSIGTATFLELTRDIIDSFYDKTLSPLGRVRKIWYVVFVLRLWREYVESKPRLSITENFLTSNCYSCIELNAHSLILILLYLKKKNMPQLFRPELLTSQTCEETFRKIRSFTTVYSTIANCSVKEIISRIDKIQLLSDISLNVNFLFPRSKAQIPMDVVVSQLPSKEEICCEIEKCKFNAMQFARKIGISPKKKSPQMRCYVRAYRGSEWYYIPDKKIERSLPTFHNLELKDYSKKLKGKQFSETSPFVKISCAIKRVIVKKSSLCWLLRTEEHKLSSDRLKRVKTKCNISTKRAIRKCRIIKKIKLRFRS